MARPAPGEVTRSALFSPDGRYRYWLTRDWAPDGYRATFIMLNPSIADAGVDDPTIRRCIGFARSWGCTGLTVLNAYALVATDPLALLEALCLGQDPIGPQNDLILESTLALARQRGFKVVAAWGANKAMTAERVRKVVQFAGGRDGLLCLGQNVDGSPKHPVRLAGDTELRRWEPTWT